MIASKYTCKSWFLLKTICFDSIEHADRACLNMLLITKIYVYIYIILIFLWIL
jgi:hypothetical protein